MTARSTVEPRHKIFIYGTLKKGQPNHPYFMDKSSGTAEYICQAVSDMEYPLIIATRYNLPFLLYAPGHGHKIEGELYEIDDKMLASLDEFEGHPTVYQRCYVQALPEKNYENGAVNITLPDSVECWTYFLKKFPPELLNTTAHANYQAFGDHGRHYNPQLDELGIDNIQEALEEECQRQQ